MISPHRIALIAALVVVIGGVPAAAAAAPTAGSGAQISAESGLTVTLGADTTLSGANPVRATDTITVAGHTIQADGPVSVTTGDLSGDRTQLTTIAADTTWLNVTPPGASTAVGLRGADLKAGWVEAVTPNDGSADLYLDGTTNGEVDLQLHGLPGGVPVGLVDADTGELLVEVQSASNGTATATVPLPDGAHAIRVETPEGSAPTVGAPSPDRYGPVQTGNVTLEAQLSDPDFGSVYGDNVTLNWQVNGETMTTTTATANGSVTATIDITEVRGRANWSVTATDAFGKQDDAGGAFRAPYRTDSGLSVVVPSEPATVAYPDAETVVIDGTAIAAAGSGTVTVAQSTPPVNLSAISMADATTWLTVTPADSPGFAVRDGITAVRVDDTLRVGDDVVDIAVSGATGTQGEIRLTELPADEYLSFSAESGVGGTMKTNSSGGGTAIVDLNGAYRLQAFDAASVINDLSPPDGSKITGDTAELSAVVDHPALDGGSVDVRFETSAGETIKSTSLTESREVSATWTVTPEQWRVVVADGTTTVTSEWRTVRAPQELLFRQEQTPAKLVNQTTVKVEAYRSDEVYQREVTNGKLDLAGLPNRVTISATGENYTAREIFVPDVTERQRVFLLNTTTTDTVESRFVLSDPSGTFTSDARIQISKPITLHNNTQFYPIVEDQIGVGGVTTVLEAGETYRLTVVSADGEIVESIGRYTADVAESVEVRPGAPEIELRPSDQGSWKAGVNVDRDANTLTWQFSDPSGETERLTATIHPRGQPDKPLTPPDTYFDPQNVSGYHELTDNQSQQEWVLNTTVRADTGTQRAAFYAGRQAAVVPAMLGDRWRTAFAIVSLLLFSGIFSVLNRGVGAVTLAVTGGIFWWTGWLSGVATAATVVVFLLIAILYATYTSGIQR